MSAIPRISLSVLLSTALVTCGGIGIILVAALLSGARIDEEGLNHYVPKGYQRQVESMLEIPVSRNRPQGQRGPIRYEPPTSSLPDFAARWGNILFDESVANPGQIRFYQLSKRLQQDIRMFNEEGTGFFEADPGGGVWMRRYYHNFALPYPERRRAQMSISLGGDPIPALISDHVRLNFAPLSEDSLTAQDVLDVRPEHWILTQGSKEHRSAAIRLIGPNGPIAMFAATDDVVQMQLIDAAHSTIYLNGLPVNQIGSKATNDFLERAKSLPKGIAPLQMAAPLQEGDRLRIQLKQNGQPGQVISLRYGKFSGGLVTRNRIENGRLVTEVDPELARILPWAADLQTAMQTYGDKHPRPDQIGKPAIRLTIDRKLHAGISNVFLPFVRQFDSSRSAVRQIISEPAAICVLNAMTGDVLAMPSYPAPEDIEMLRARMTNRSLTNMTKPKLIRLAQNQNLHLVPIGSTIKPLIAATAWETTPALRTLVVDENGVSRSSLYGIEFSSYSTVARGRVTPESFLQVSSNDYTINLGLLAIASNLRMGADGKPSFEGGRADFSRNLSGNTFRLPLDEVGGPPMWPKMRDAFDIRLRDGFTSVEENKWESSPLEALFSQIKAEGKLLYDAFSPVIPERTNLQLSTMQSFRGDFVSLMLGSGTNRWSNLHLAQAYARIGTGRQVKARLVTTPGDKTKLNDFPQTPISAPVLALVHTGMSRAVQNLIGSTAAKIASSLESERTRLRAKGYTLFAIGKTGTAMRVSAKESKDGVPRECAAFCLYLELRNAQGTPLAATVTSTYLQDRAATRGGARNSGVAVELTNGFVKQITAWMEEQAKSKS